MANRLFRTYVHALMSGGANIPDLDTADIRCVLVDVGTHDPDTAITGDEFLSDIPGGARLAVTANLASKTVVDGVFDAADISVPDAGGGATGEELIIYYHTGVESTSRLIALIDTATGLPITLDGVADLVRWHASGIFAL